MNDIFSHLSSNYDNFKQLVESEKPTPSQGRKWTRQTEGIAISPSTIQQTTLPPATPRKFTVSTETLGNLEDLFQKVSTLREKINTAAPEEKLLLEQEFSLAVLELNVRQMTALSQMATSDNPLIMNQFNQSKQTIENLVNTLINDHKNTSTYADLTIRILKILDLKEPTDIALMIAKMHVHSSSKDAFFKDIQQILPEESQRAKVIMNLEDPRLLLSAARLTHFDDSALYETIARKVVDNKLISDGKALTAIIDKIPNKDTRIELLLKVSSRTFSQAITNYGLQNASSMSKQEKEQFCNNIAIANFTRNCFAWDEVASAIQAFGLDHSDYPYSLAVRLAPVGIEYAKEVMASFPLKDPEQFLGVLTAAVSEGNYISAEAFDKLYSQSKIEDNSEKKFALAQLLAESRHYIPFIPQLNLSDGELRALLPACTKASAFATAALFKITDSTRIFEMLKWEAHYNSAGLIEDFSPEYIENCNALGINSEQQFEIISILMQKNPQKIYNVMGSLNIAPPEQQGVVDMLTKNLAIGFLKNDEIDCTSGFHPSQKFNNEELQSPIIDIGHMLQRAKTLDCKITPSMTAKETEDALVALNGSLNAIRESCRSMGGVEIIPEIEQFLDKAGSLQNLNERHTNQIWAASVFAAIKALNLSNAKQKELLPLLQGLMEYRNPLLRREMTAFLFENITAPLSQTPADGMRLPMMLLSSFGIESPAVQKFLQALRADPRFLKDARKMHILNQTLVTLASNPMLTLQEKTRLLDALVSKTDKPSLPALKDLQSVQDLIELHQYSYLKQVNTHADIDKVYQALFQQEFTIAAEDFQQKYAATIDTWRNKSSVITYLGRLNKLPSHDKQKAVAILKTFVGDVLNQKFSESRYAQSKVEGSHLHTVFRDNPKLEATWKQGMTFDVAELKATTSFPLGDMIAGAILSHEFDDRISKNSPIYQLAISRDPAQIEERKVAIKQEIDEKSKKLKGATPDQKKQLAQELSSLNLERTLLDNFTRKIDPSKESDRSVLSYVSNAAKNKPLESKINDILQKEAKSGLTIALSDNPNDYVQMGTEIENSCQIVSGDPRLNKALMGYAMDGKNRILVVKDDSGQMIGRVVLRLLLDENNKPVLFRERIYVNNIGNQAEVNTLLLKGTMRFAEELNVPMATAELEENEKPQAPALTLHSLGGPAPFEYKDAIGPSNMEPVYSIKNSHSLYQPRKINKE